MKEVTFIPLSLFLILLLPIHSFGDGTINIDKLKIVDKWKDGKFDEGERTIIYTFKNEDKRNPANPHFFGKDIYLSMYVGKFKDGKKNGKGMMIFSDGSKYVGEWSNDKPNGQGTMTFSNSSKYVGEIKDGEFHGEGTLTFPNGKKYVGKFLNGKYYGQGILTFSDGTKFVGEFRNGSITEIGIWIPSEK
jgi:hypothetical protein